MLGLYYLYLYLEGHGRRDKSRSDFRGGRDQKEHNHKFPALRQMKLLTLLTRKGNQIRAKIN